MGFLFSVGNICHVNFISQLFYISLKDSDNAKDGFTKKALYEILATAFAFIFLDMDRVMSSGLTAAAAQGIQKLSAVVRDVCKAIKEDYFKAIIKGCFRLGEKEQVSSDYGVHQINRFCDGGNSVKQVVSSILPTAIAV